MSVKVTGQRKVEREIRALQKRLGFSAGTFADMAASVVRKAVVRNAQPFGLGKKALESGKGAIRKDLFDLFQLVPEKARGSAGVITSVTAARVWHQQRRTRNGRARRGAKKKIIPSVFRMYVDEVQKRVGMAKGSVMGGGDARLQGRFAAWIKRWSGSGDAGRRTSIFGAIWTFRSEAKHAASDRVLGVRGVKRAFAWKDINLRRVLRARMKRELKKGQVRVNR